MGKAIRTGMRVRMKEGPAHGATGTVINDMCRRLVRWDPGTIVIPEGFTSDHGEAQLERIKE